MLQNYQASACNTPSCISLFSTGPKLDFCSKKRYFLFTPLSKILVARLVVFTAADRFFKRFYGPQTKRAKKCCRPNRSLFLDMNTEPFKLRVICSHKRSEAKVQSLLVPPHFRLMLPHFVFSGDGADGWAALFKNTQALLHYLKIVFVS